MQLTRLSAKKRSQRPALLRFRFARYFKKVICELDCLIAVEQDSTLAHFAFAAPITVHGLQMQHHTLTEIIGAPTD